LPAIQLARLRIQVAQLVDTLSQPAQFVRKLHDMLEFYADRIYRRGQSGAAPPRLPHYQVPPQVLRQIENDLTPLAAADPAAALALADVLWEDGYVESRLLAIHLICVLPPDPPERIFMRLRLWAQPMEEPRVLEQLLASGKSRLQREHPELWLEQVQRWVQEQNPGLQGIGLQALVSMVNDESYQNLPSLFRILMPMMSSISSGLLPDLITVVEGLVRRSPAETAYFLRQALSLGRETGAARLVRRCLPLFPAELQTSLRAALVSTLKTE